MSPIGNAGMFLIKTVFELYVFILILRLVLPWVRADFYHPLSQFVLKLTDPLVRPFDKFLPRVSFVNLSVLVVLFLFDGLKILLLIAIQFNTIPNFLGLFVWVIADLLEQGINLMFFSILVVVIVSWVNPQTLHPVIVMLHRLTDPYLRVFRRVIPHVAGFDISPIPALLVLKLMSIVFVYPIIDFVVTFI
jgi:YggT family protein